MRRMIIALVVYAASNGTLFAQLFSAGVQTSVPEGKVEVVGQTADSITFAAVDPNPVPQADGQGHEHTPCDQAELKVAGVRVQGRPGCKRFCVDVPAGNEPVDHTAWVRECTDNTWHDPCPKSGGACPVGWVRVERAEWYPDKSRACIAVKNWSHDRNRCFLGRIMFAPKR